VSCKFWYQLKGQQSRIGNSIAAGAFEAMMEAIQTDRTPNCCDHFFQRQDAKTQRRKSSENFFLAPSRLSALALKSHRRCHRKPGFPGSQSPRKVPSRQTPERHFRRPTRLDAGRFEHRARERDRPGRRWQRLVANRFSLQRSAGRRPPRARRTRSPFHPRTGKTPSRQPRK